MSSRFFLACVMCVSFGSIWVAESINLLNTSTSKIVGNSNGIQYLPESYVRSFDRWRVTVVESTKSIRLEPIPVAKTTSTPLRLRVDDGNAKERTWVRPSLQVLIKGGIPSYIMAGVDVSFTGESEDNESSLVWGASAQQWTTFGLTVEPNFRMVLFAGDGDGTDDLIASANAASVRQAMEYLGQVLQLPESNQLSEGFHILSLPLSLVMDEERRKEDSTDQVSSWTLLSHALDTSKQYSLLTCLATAEHDAREILTLDPLLAEMTVTSILQIPLPPAPLVDAKTEEERATEL